MSQIKVEFIEIAPALAACGAEAMLYKYGISTNGRRIRIAHGDLRVEADVAPVFHSFRYELKDLTSNWEPINEAYAQQGGHFSVHTVANILFREHVRQCKEENKE